MVTPEALPEPSDPPFSANATLLSSTRLVGSLWGLVLCLGGHPILALTSGVSESSPREPSQLELDEVRPKSFMCHILRVRRGVSQELYVRYAKSSESRILRAKLCTRVYTLVYT